MQSGGGSFKGQGGEGGQGKEREGRKIFREGGVRIRPGRKLGRRKGKMGNGKGGAKEEKCTHKVFVQMDLPYSPHTAKISFKP